MDKEYLYELLRVAGVAIRYWATVKQVVKDRTGQVTHLDFVDRDGAPWVIGIDFMSHAYDRRPDLFTGSIDPDVADAIVQTTLYGEMKYAPLESEEERAEALEDYAKQGRR